MKDDNEDDTDSEMRLSNSNMCLSNSKTHKRAPMRMCMGRAGFSTVRAAFGSRRRIGPGSLGTASFPTKNLHRSDIWGR
eukprot:12074428-Heterocapsa_arctica.AAC.1